VNQLLETKADATDLEKVCNLLEGKADAAAVEHLTRLIESKIDKNELLAVK
jgi:hypothetical protein